ncbi:hypothetical protein NECID01_1400 [Nematocida sp. AWRm77]|nr:hypothetical protein NECID01_1400 [Nematocida sp. AWRm77]
MIFQKTQLFLLVCCSCIALLLMAGSVQSSSYIAEIEKINASVEEDRANMEKNIDIAYVAALDRINEYCNANSKRRADANIKEDRMFLQNSDTILMRYAADRSACACLLPVIIEKYAAELADQNQDPETIQDKLANIAQELSHSYVDLLDTKEKDLHMKKAIENKHADLCDKWKAAAKEVEALLKQIAQTEKENSAQNLPNAPSPDLLSFIEDWKRLVANQAEIRDSLVSLLKDALLQLENEYIIGIGKKGKYLSFVRSTTEFMFLTEYIDMVDRYYFSNTPPNPLNSTPLPNFRLEAFSANNIAILENTFKDRGIIFVKAHQEDGILRERLNELRCLYRDFIQPNPLMIDLEFRMPEILARSVLYINEKYPKHVDKTHGLIGCLFKELDSFLKLYKYGKKYDTDNYSQHFQSVISPLLEKNKRIVNLAISVAEDPELFKTQNKIDKLLDEIKDLTALHKGPSEHAIDLSLGSSMDEEIMKKWVQAVFQLPEPPLYYDLTKEDSNDLIQKYKAYKKHRRNAKASWSSYLVKDIASPQIKEKVQTLANVLDGTTALVEYVVGCMMSTVKDGKSQSFQIISKSDLFTHCFYVIDSSVAFISTAVYNRRISDLNLSLVNPLEEYKKALMDTYIKCFRTTPKDLDKETRASISLASFYANPKVTTSVCIEMLNTLRMVYSSTTNLELHFMPISAFRNAINVFRRTQAKLEGYREKALAYSTPRPAPEAPVSIDMQQKIQEKARFIDETFSKCREFGLSVIQDPVVKIIRWLNDLLEPQLTDLQKCIDSLDPSINSSLCKESLNNVEDCLGSLYSDLMDKRNYTKKQNTLDSKIQMLIQNLEFRYYDFIDFWYKLMGFNDNPNPAEDNDNGQSNANDTNVSSISDIWAFLSKNSFIICGVSALLVIGGGIVSLLLLKRK